MYFFFLSKNLEKNLKMFYMNNRISMEKKLFILASTIDNRILNLQNIIQSEKHQVSYIISHQVTKKTGQEVESYLLELSKRTDIIYHELIGKGVAKNRNNTLKYIEPSSVCLILDDDIYLCPNAFENVLNAFDNTDADFISFKILDMEGNDYKSYPTKKQWHTLGSLTGIGTTEIAFRSDLILNSKIKFDEDFGPGSDIYPIGEDFIFVMDLYKRQTKMLFVPIPIVQHARESTGTSLDKKVIFGRGAMFARVFGWKAFFIDFLFSVKKYPTYRKEISFIAYCLLLVKGTNNYFISHKKRVS